MSLEIHTSHFLSLKDNKIVLILIIVSQYSLNINGSLRKVKPG